MTGAARPERARQYPLPPADEQATTRIDKDMNCLRTIWLLPGALLLAAGACAQDDVNAMALERAAFAEVLAEIETGKRDAVPAELARYPLTPYLHAALLRRALVQDPGPENDAAIVAWLDRHAALPMADDLRRDWLRRVAKRKDWTTFHAQYRPTGSATLQCHYLHARTRVEAAELVEPDAMDRWLSGSSQPDACDPVFAWLKARGLLTEQRIYERMMLAMEARQSGLVRYLMRKLPERRQAYAKDWLAMRSDPARQIARIAKAGKLRDDDEAGLLQTGLKTLAWRDSEAAYKALQSLKGVRGIDDGLRARLQRDVALGLAYDRDARGYELFADVAVPDGILGPKAREWRVRSALYQGQWADVRRWIEAMPTEQRKESAWRYWYARALDQAGERDEARAIDQRLARERSYYGYLAADRTSARYAIDHSPVTPDAELQRSFANLAGVVRAREWFLLDRPAEARVEWVAVVGDLEPAAQQQAALVADRWGWHEQAIITLARSKYWDDMHVRYPLPHADDIDRLARQTAVPQDFIWGIARSESLFARDARSGAGAYGLMQLLPATAKRVARGAGLTYTGRASLYEPDVNLTLGTQYLADLLERFDGSLPFAAAAYNTGEHRVERWRPPGDKDAAIWVENIPYTETRLYVQKVLKHMTGFGWRRTGQPVPVTTRLGSLPPPPVEQAKAS